MRTTPLFSGLPLLRGLMLVCGKLWFRCLAALCRVTPTSRSACLLLSEVLVSAVLLFTRLGRSPRAGMRPGRPARDWPSALPEYVPQRAASAAVDRASTAIVARAM